jgi:hypothetical protein
VYNNTIYLTSPQSKGITCGFCGSSVLTVKNNIFWVNREPISSDGAFIEEHNIFWAPGGNPLLNFPRNLTSIVNNPSFINELWTRLRLGIRMI